MGTASTSPSVASIIYGIGLPRPGQPLVSGLKPGGQVIDPVLNNPPQHGHGDGGVPSRGLTLLALP
jgi:hypothetical protein